MEFTAQQMPYAPPSSVVSVIQRFRERGLTEPITSSTLQQVGVSSGNAPRTLQAIKFLSLVDGEGAATETFQRLRRASTQEYPDMLAEILRNVYHPIFNLVDPAQDDLTQLDDAFRGSKPEGQRQRMVTLFLGLCSEAGIVGEDKAPKMQTQPRQQRSSRRSSSSDKRRQESKPKQEPSGEKPPRREPESKTTDYPLVQAVIEQLPKNGQWTEKRRDLWIQAMTSAIDLAIEIKEPEEVHEGEVIIPHLELED